MELVTLGIFCAALVGAIFTGVPTVCALLVGLAAFCIYAWRWSGSARRVARMCWEGIAPIAKILGMLALIGVLTGLWRAAGRDPRHRVLRRASHQSRRVFVGDFSAQLPCFRFDGDLVWYGCDGGIHLHLDGGCHGRAAFRGRRGGAFRGVFLETVARPFSTSALLVADLTGTDFYNNLSSMGKERGGSLCADVRRVLRAGAAYPRKRRGGRYGRFAGERICRGARGSAAAGDRVRPGLDAR